MKPPPFENLPIKNRGKAALFTLYVTVDRAQGVFERPIVRSGVRYRPWVSWTFDRIRPTVSLESEFRDDDVTIV